MTALRAASPADLGALKALIAETSGPLCYIAGGTDLLVAPRAPPDDGWLIDISRTAGLAFIRADAAALRIGATTIFDALARDPTIWRLFGALAEAAEQSGSAQIRNRATIGGNVAGASPAGDLLPVLACADARFTVFGRDGAERTLAFDALIRGHGGASLAPGELIAEIEIPLARRLTRSAFVKLGRRDDLAISRLNLTMEADFDFSTRRFGEARLVAGALAPTPLRLPGVAEILRGAELGGPLLRAFSGALLSAVDAAIPGRASRLYKRRAVVGLGLDLLEAITGVKGLDALEESAA
ncbi:MAG: FAD binding domain-containing protein [Roseiarcus sp.]